MVTTAVKKFVLMFVLATFFTSCSVIFKSTIPYSDRQNYLLELEKERKIIQSMEDKLPPSQIDMAIRLNLAVQNAVKEGREPKYVLFLYRIYSQKLLTLLESAVYGATMYRTKEKEEELPPQVEKKLPTSYPAPSTVEMQPQKLTPPPEEEERCKFDEALEHYNNQEWSEAYMGFLQCVEAGVKVDEAGKYLRDIEDRVILPEWNRANLLVYQGRSESNPQRKKEFLEKAKEILENLLKEYPNNRYSPRIERNIQIIDKLLTQIQG